MLSRLLIIFLPSNQVDIVFGEHSTGIFKKRGLSENEDRGVYVKYLQDLQNHAKHKGFYRRNLKEYRTAIASRGR